MCAARGLGPDAATPRGNRPGSTSGRFRAHFVHLAATLTDHAASREASMMVGHRVTITAHGDHVNSLPALPAGARPLRRR